VSSQALRRSGAGGSALADGVGVPPEAVAQRHEPLEAIGLGGLVLLAPAAVLYLAFNAGGYFPSAPGVVAIVLVQGLVLRTLLAERPFEGYSRALAVPLGALTLLAAWTLASALWAHATARVLDAYDRMLLYVLALALFGALRYTRARVSWLMRALLAGLGAVCIIGLISRVLPHAWPTTSAFFADRLNYPLTYWNAEGMVAALALILGFHLTADPQEHWSARVLSAMLLPAVGATLLLTFSRGSLGVAAVGLVAYCVLTRLHTLPTALLAAVPATAVAMRSAWDATALATSKATGPLAISQGHHVAVVVGACMLAAGALRLALLPVDRRISRVGAVRHPPPQRVRMGIGAGVAVLMLILALALGAGGAVHRTYDKFVKGTNESKVAQTRERLSDPANNGRLPLWTAALDIYRMDKFKGTGGGTYQQYYPQVRTNVSYVTDAHSLYLQSLAELGVVGFVLMALVVGGMLVGLALRIRGPDRGVYAAVFAMVLAWAVHQAFDWDWQMPAVSITVFILAGLALARPRDGRAGLRGLPAGRAVVALGWLIVAVAPLLVSTSYARLQHAGRELQRGECAPAKREALSSLSLGAERPQAYAIVGTCDLQEGFAPAAVTAMSKAAGYEPQSWEDAYLLAIARAGAGKDPFQAARRAIALNPQEPMLRDAYRRLRKGGPRRWEALAPGLRRQALLSGKFSIMNL
jgi:O-antigen ligase